MKTLISNCLFVLSSLSNQEKYICLLESVWIFLNKSIQQRILWVILSFISTNIHFIACLVHRNSHVCSYRFTMSGFQAWVSRFESPFEPKAGCHDTVMRWNKTEDDYMIERDNFNYQIFWKLSPPKTNYTSRLQGSQYPCTIHKGHIDTIEHN